ncbi:Hypothetical protein TPAS_781 [Trichococcus pasteurii]|uniref:Uncharacterized protein n=1 Tax=Trichococcus pasteurii TaxID=43064 RepID=A0A1W1IDM1_9LACT|nr:hypothetical protein SAMN04488086_11333 [Trichococcus pasteurii]SLM51106.1 Hypothetical protein TPAS_781 [Trichococcus pasteurii]SSB91987.1 Hypothetical protein TPAS_781 [Trichococcus pasteurii]
MPRNRSIARELALGSGVPSALQREQPRGPAFVNCSERFATRTAEMSGFCQLFRVLCSTNSREVDLLSAVQYSKPPQQPTSSSITGFWYNKEEPPQKSRWLFFVLNNLIFGQIRIICIFWKSCFFSPGLDYWNNFLYIAIVSSNVGVNGFPGAQASIMAFLDR